MAERRHRDRVDQLRIEAGVPLSPESVEVRHARLVQMQMESLGTRRRDFISSHDYRENRGPATSLRVIEASRLSNQPGTEEFLVSQEHQEELASWNNAYVQLEGDGTLEEDLRDINRGQTHRIKLMGDQSIRDHNRGNSQDGSHPRGSGVRGGHPHGVDSSRGTDSPRGTDRASGTGGTNRSRGVDRPRGGGRGGRGGGIAGAQTRGSRTGRTPVGYPDTISPMPSVRQESRTSEVPHTSDTEILAAGYNQSLQPESSSSKSRLNDDDAAPARAILTAAAPATKRPAPQNWEHKLASPETFMAAMNRGSPTPLAANQGSIATIAETRQGTVARDVTMTSQEVDRTGPSPSTNEVEQPDLGDSASETADILISTSTSVELKPGNISRLTPSPLAAEKKSPFSYSNDLVGLELGTGPSSSVVPSPIGTNLSGIMEHLVPFLPAIRQQLMPDTVAQLDEIVAQLSSKNLKPSTSAAAHDTKQVVPREQPSTGEALQDLPSNKVEERLPMAANSKGSTISNKPEAAHNESGGKLEKEMVSRQRSFSRTALQDDFHQGPSRKGRVNMIIGTHLMPGQSNRQEITRSNSEASSLGRQTLPPHFNTDPTTQSSLALLTSKFDELRLGRTGENKPTQNLATVNPFGSTPSSSGAIPPASVKLPLPGTFKRSDKLVSAGEQFSAILRERGWYEGDSNATSTGTGLKESGVSTTSNKPNSISPFAQHSPPPGGSTLNRTGFFKPENNSSPSMSQPAPASPVWPVASSTTQGQREHVTPGTYPATSQSLGSFRTGPSKMNSSGFFQTPNQTPGPTSRAALTAQPAPARSPTPSVITNLEGTERTSVFKTTVFPTGPSQLNRTGLFREENQHPVTKKSEK
ncbi:hypothetical protein MMC22_000770 [Lobaria immixta]|nr:hypothetical protein [Lobaria immixta]